MSNTKPNPLTGRPIQLYTGDYYLACGIGGILSCGLTHTFVTPLDVVKCNAQVNPKDFPGVFSGFRNIYSGKVSHLGFKSGLAGVLKGWGPTIWGYSAQGAFKFGFYEYFKHLYGEMAGPENSKKYKDLIYVAGSASAELIADIALCPFEAVKVRIQTDPLYARGLIDGMPKMIAKEGFGNLYASLGPLWARQVPYTIMKFVAFERIAEYFYSFFAPRKKSELSQLETMSVVFSAGYAAGILCAVVSHPADTMVSKINKIKMAGSLGEKMRFIYTGTAEQPGIGFAGLWKGLGARTFMVGTLTGLQWFIYGAFKVYVGLPAPGGADTPVAKK